MLNIATSIVSFIFENGTNILSGLISDFGGNFFSAILIGIGFWLYRKYKKNFSAKTTVSFNKKFDVNCLYVDVYNHSDKVINIEELQIVLEEQYFDKQKYITDVKIKDCYLKTDDKAYAEDYYPLEPSRLVQFKIFFTEISQEIDFKNNLKLIFIKTEDNKLSIPLNKYKNKKHSKLILKYNYFEIICSYIELKNKKAEIIKQIPFSRGKFKYIALNKK